MVLSLFVILFMPAYASAQTLDIITILENFGNYDYDEDLFVDVYDQKDTLIEEIALKDNSSGLFTEVLSRPFEPGLYVTQPQYHDVVVTDFFNVR